jgi:hypothetical protein
MNLDIEMAVRTIFVLLLIGTGWILFNAWRNFREARNIPYYLKRQRIMRNVGLMFFSAFFLILFAFWFNRFAEPIAYTYFPPSPTITYTPTSTFTPTITLTPTITNTPTFTLTPLFTSIPVIPVIVAEGFSSSFTPNPDAVFSPITFSRGLDKNLKPIESATVFNNPIVVIYGTFSYDQMVRGSQWSALWFRDGSLFFYESFPWDGFTGGVGYTECRLPAEEWLPGEYEVQIYVGEVWKRTGQFSVSGDPPTPTSTVTRTPTITPSPTIIQTATITSSPTVTVSPQATNTVKPTNTPRPTISPTRTPTK